MREISIERLLRPVGQIRKTEAATAFLMFSYSFLAMASYNIIKPVTRSKFISDLGAENLPYVTVVAGLLIGVLMAGYAWLMSRLPRRWCLPIVQGGMAVLFVVFWLLFRTREEWVSVAFYVAGLILGILLISQFWTLANVVYDPRQAKRLFGFIGGGAPLGGMAGSFITDHFAARIGTTNLLLFSAGAMVLCLIVVIFIISREKISQDAPIPVVGEEKGVGARRALELLKGSKHLRLIALVISFAAIGAAIIDQQLSMAISASKGQAATDAITSFLARVQFLTSLIGFLIQISLTSRIHRYLGIGFALMMLPSSLGLTGIVVLLNATLWAPAFARVLDQSLRYNIDKTTREILYMPLSDEIKFEAKPFVDVTVDRFAKAMGGLLLVILIQPWGVGLRWPQLSYASVAMTALWIFMAWRAKRGYQMAFRQSMDTREMRPAEMRVGVADLSTIETLMQELASPDERRVLYAIEILESLDKRNLVTPLLLYHESSAVRVRTLSLLSGNLKENAVRWLPAIQRMIRDKSAEVRAAAVGALANIRDQKATDLVRPYLEDPDPRIVMTAAMVLSGSEKEEDAAHAESVLTALVSDTRDSAAAARRDFAIAMRLVPVPHCRRLLIPLLSDADPEVAEEAMHTIRKIGASDFIFVPTLISLLRHRKLKSSARDLLISYGEGVLLILSHFLHDPEEDIWVRRHIPATIARIPSQLAMDTLVGALGEPDGFLRFKVIAALERLHRSCPQLQFKREAIEAQVLGEGARGLEYLSLQRALRQDRAAVQDTLLARALDEKKRRAIDRVYRLLSLLYPWKDIAAARYAIERNHERSRAGAIEYLDNTLTGNLRKRLMPLLEEAPGGMAPAGQTEGSRPGPRGFEQSLLRLIDDEDPVISAAAIHLAARLRLTSLSDDLERVLSTRPVKDWIVFESASWSLASIRLSEEKRKILWHEPLPAVEMADRLRSLPLFASVSIDELFRISEAGRQVHYEPGRVICQEGVIPTHMQLLLDGRMVSKAQAGDLREIEAPGVAGFQEILEGRPMQETVRAADQSICLTLSGDECYTLLSDSMELAQGLFRMLCDGGREASWPLVLKGRPLPGRAESAGAGLKPIEKVIILKGIPAFSAVRAEEMLNLASIAEEVPVAAETDLFVEADPPAIYALISGELSLESARSQPAMAAGPSDVVGLYETLAGIAFERRARVVGRGAALRIGREELFDLLAQNPDFLQQMFVSLFRARAQETEAVPA